MKLSPKRPLKILVRTITVVCIELSQ